MSNLPKSMHDPANCDAAAAPIRILHLSDIHFSDDHDWKMSPVLMGLARTIRNLVCDGLALNVVAITGDIANSGRPAEYESARRWICDVLIPSIPGFDPENLFLVPGNHDVDRSRVDHLIVAMQQHLLSELNQQHIADALKPSAYRDLFLARHAAYLQFAASVCPHCCDGNIPWWSAMRTFDGCGVLFSGFCSSWMSYSNDDKGKLLIGTYQCYQLLGNTNDTPLSIALVHHPWSYLPDFDLEVATIIRKHCKIVLRGHLHDPDGETIVNPRGQVLELAAGPCYARDGASHGFQIVEVVPRAGTVRVNYFVWKKNEWQRDLNAWPQARNGIADFGITAVS
jgi:hypothetical protein